MFLILLFIGETSVSGVNETHLWLETPGWKTQFYNEASADLFVNSFQVGARFLLDAEKLRDTLTRTQITQRYFAYRGEEFELRLGNYYTTPGYGLVLSSFEDKALRIDRNLDGGRLGFAKNWLGLNVLAGRMLEDDKLTRDEWLYAAELKVSPLDALDVGAIYLRRDATQDADTLFGRAFEEWAEENLTLRLWRFDLGAAAAQRFTWGRKSAGGWIGIDNIKGFGIFTSLSYAQKGFGILVEGKSYRGLQGGINAPPPANPDGESLNEGADEQGFQVQANFVPWNWLSGTAGYALAWDSDSAERSSLSRTGIETRLELGGHTFTPFFTWIDRQIPGGINPENDRLEAGLSYQTLIGNVSLNFKGSYRNVAEVTERWHEPHALLEVGWRSWLLSAGGVAAIADSVELWPWGSVRFTSYPFDLTLSYGRFKGEYICKNGVCSYELPFDGLKADLTLYF